MNMPLHPGKEAETSPGLGYRGHIEGLRAVAILLVVAAHVGVPGLSGGFVGVDVFFVVSGYLITGLLVLEREKSGRIDFAHFYARRIRRLLPAWTLTLTVTSVLGFLLIEPALQLGQAEAGLAAALWASNLHFALGQFDYFAPAVESNLFLHTWSLGVEEQFYLIWPLLVAAALSVRNRAALGVSMLLVAAFSFLLSLWLSWAEPQLAFYLMPTRAWQFALGALTFLGQRENGEEKRLLGGLGFLGIAMLAFGALHLTGEEAYPGFWALLPAVGTVGLLLSRSNSIAHRWLSSNVLQWIGRRSYGWYLWHWPVLLIGSLVLGNASIEVRALLAAMALLMASGVYAWVEQPFRNNRWLSARPKVVLLGGLWLVILAMLLASWWRNDAEQTEARARQDQMVLSGDSEARRLGCGDRWYRNGGFVMCWYGPPDALHTAVLLGDSVAAQWAPALRKIFSIGGWRLVVSARFSCPLPEASFFSRHVLRNYAACDHWRQAAIDSIADLKPDLVFVSSADTYPLGVDQWTKGTIQLLQAIAPHSGRTVLIRATPTLPVAVAACGKKQTRLREVLARPGSCEASATGLISDEVYAAQRNAAARFPNVTTIDLTEFICPGGICKARDSNRMIYRDSNHLDVNFARSLSPAIVRISGLQTIVGPGISVPSDKSD